MALTNSPGTVDNVTTGKRRVDGGIYFAPAGTTAPTDATTALASAFKNLGYVSEDGVTNSLSKETSEIKEWGGDTVDVVLTGQSDTFSFKFIESFNIDTLKCIYGSDNVTGSSSTGAISITVNAEDAPSGVYVIDMIQRGGRLKRIVIPNGKITELGDIVYKADEAVGYECTLAANLDSNGNTHYEYIGAVSTS